jgi:hypothetical protein
MYSEIDLFIDLWVSGWVQEIDQSDREKIPSPEPRNSWLAAKAKNVFLRRKLDHFTGRQIPFSTAEK